MIGIILDFIVFMVISTMAVASIWGISLYFEMKENEETDINIEVEND